MSLDTAGVDPGTGRFPWRAENPPLTPVQASVVHGVRRLVHDLTVPEAVAEDAGMTRDDMTAEQRAESLAECAHNLMAEKRGLLARLEATNRELVRVLAANVPLQPLATYGFEDLAIKGSAMLATIDAAEALGHTVAVEFYRDDFTHRISGITIGVRVAA